MVHILDIINLWNVLLVKPTAVLHALMNLSVEHEDVSIGNYIRRKLQQNLDIGSRINYVEQAFFKEHVKRLLGQLEQIVSFWLPKNDWQVLREVEHAIVC